MKGHLERKGGLKQTLQAALAAASVLSTPLPAEAAKLKTEISQSVSAEVPNNLRGLFSDWEKAKKDPEESKAWLTVNSAFQDADPRRKLDIIKFFAKKENVDKGTVVTSFLIQDFQKWKEAGPESKLVMRMLLSLDTYSAITHADVYIKEPWALEVIQKSAKEYPRVAVEKYDSYKSVPGAFGVLRSLLQNPLMPRVESSAYLDTTKSLRPEQSIQLRKELPSERVIDFEVASSSQSDHFSENPQFQKELGLFPADTFPFEALKPLSENPSLSQEELTAYREYYTQRISRIGKGQEAYRNRIVEKRVEALERLSRFGQHPVEMSMNALVVFRRLQVTKMPMTRENIIREVATIRAERDSIRNTDMFAGDTLLFTHGQINDSTYNKFHPKGHPYFSTKEQTDTLRGLVESRGYRFDSVIPVKWLDDGTAHADRVLAGSAKVEILRWISGPHKGPIRVRFIGHGGPEGMFLTDGENLGDKEVKKTKETRYIGVSELVTAIAQRAMTGADTTKDVFVLDGCYQHDFIQKVLDSLSRGNIPPPVFVSAADKSQVALIFPTTPFGPQVTKELTLAPRVGDLMRLTKPGLRSHPSVFAPTLEKGRWRGKQVSGTFEIGTQTV